MDDGGGDADGVNLMQAAEAESSDSVSSSLRSMGYTVDGGGETDDSDQPSTDADRSLREMASLEDVLILLGVLVILALSLLLLVT